MSENVRVIFLVGVMVLLFVAQINTSAHARSLKYLKEDLEAAVHDASLAVDEEQLSNGVLVFDKDKALSNFKESLTKNTVLTDEDYTVKLFKTFDNTDTTFPHTFTDSATGLTEEVLYPTVLVVIETETGKYFGGSDQKKVERVASYSYRMKDPNPTGSITSLSMGVTPYIGGLEQYESGFYWTVPYTKNVTSQHGMRVHPITGVTKQHTGIDIAMGGVDKQPVISARKGTVTYAGRLGSYGNLVIVDHGKGLTTRYGHLSSIAVKKGEEVDGAQIVGRVGSTGSSTAPHLHYEIRVNGEPINPLSAY
ncbi:M23 family metallopeptidase [Halobacillus locisalis]|uniref:M23 family metallopeptidase n=1 Tax=Halobacillus locisalis TaxID=220753 RepID=A0A838CY19_9BACI|nr:M23 family metallopeptidase [Halobacillus locisalis]MBA2176833.1 M23 family metallopeptidase [Halobacillus locisalis]